ncbi:MAG: glycosyltransferase family 2 protein [Candidatus Pseudobacter hemicellulosilyticus]|uniref:Glycosyltransferase family 2 protein n=1 Tax=Candidatus Pseudobacter hemicellulosilyticus TaxID=3121375 RepID=A0AAJ5WSJ1_9BACT|nr:MAG: glycosyltransferase family 2 protein [Pseudobacter sp.]
MPKVSVGIAVYNGEQFIARAVSSVLRQTITDLELIIVNDGSTDGTLGVLEQFTDPRIILLKNDGNKGVTYTRNRYCAAAAGEYLAVLDADDEWPAEKLEKQLAYMDAHPEVGVSGTYGDRINPGKYTYTWKYPLTHEEIQVRLLWGSALIHSTTIFRMAVLKANNITYTDRPALNGVEDYKIFTDCIKHTRIANIPESLLNYFEHEGQITTRTKRQQVGRAVIVAKEYVEQVMKIPVDELRNELITKSFLFDFDLSATELEAFGKYLQELDDANRRIRFFNEGLLRKNLAEKWYQACYHSRLPFGRRMKRYYAAPAFLRKPAGVYQNLKLAAKAAATILHRNTEKA